MKFKKMSVKNFMSVGNNPVVIDFTKSQSTVVGGMNGSGKSAITCESVVYALTGKTLKKTTLPRIVNKFNKKNLLVTLDFESNGNEYQVVRGMKPTIFEIYRNGEKLNVDAASKDLQSKLEFITGVDYNSLTQMIVLNLERFKPFMEMTSQERRIIVEDILNISVFGEMNKLQKDVIKELNNKKSDIQYEIDKSNGKKLSLENVIKNANESNEKYLKDLESQIQEQMNEIELLNDNIEQLSSNIIDLTEINNKLSLSKSNKDEANTQLKILMSDVNNIDKSVKFLSQGNCPTCSQELLNADESIKKHECEKLDLISKSSEYITIVENETKNINELQIIINEQSKYQSDINGFKHKIMMAENKAKTLMTEYEKQSNKKSDDVDSVQSMINTIDSEIEVLNKEYDSVIVDIEKNKIALDILSDSGVKLTIIKDYIDFINYRVNDYLNGMEFYINITLDESFNESFSSPSKEGMIYADLSTGQKRRVNLAIWLALIEVSAIKNSVTSNVLFLDEILENMDSLGIELFIKLIKEKMPNKNVFIITQRFEQFRDLFQSEIYFNLVDGYTEMQK